MQISKEDYEKYFTPLEIDAEDFDKIVQNAAAAPTKDIKVDYIEVTDAIEIKGVLLRVGK